MTNLNIEKDNQLTNNVKKNVRQKNNNKIMIFMRYDVNSKALCHL